MFVFAGLFAATACVGALLGLGAIQYPSGHHISSYGWTLFINATALCVLVLFNLYHRRQERLR
ncbi:hypothetical protein ACRAWG_26160 [Methylobacterium sp. P31]